MRALTDSDVDAMTPHALALVGAVHDDDPHAVDAALTAALNAPVGGVGTLAVVLAAMVPDDQSGGELLGWRADPDEYRRLREMGVDSRAAGTLAAQHGAQRLRDAIQKNSTTKGVA